MKIQAQEFAREKDGYTATKHQAEIGAGYFDEVLLSVSPDLASAAALAGSTESAQFS